MRIDKIYIRNFKNFGDEGISFALNPHFTVIIGINGRGKSTLLHALRIACGAYFLRIPDAESKHIEEDEIRREEGKRTLYKWPVIVEAEGFLGETLTWRRQIPLHKKKTTVNQEDVGKIRDIGEAQYKLIQQSQDALVDLPVITFWGTSRLSGAGQNRLKTVPRIGREIFKEGYSNWKEMKSLTFQYSRWLASYDILLKNGKEYVGTKEAFFEAIKIANPYIEAVEFEASELWLKLNLDRVSQDYLPLSFHSDGINSFTGMVAELAFRCIVLNAHYGAEAVKKSKGVVMIDELDLHLHPNWQRHVVHDLKKAFPNLQFVATTHSPFIVQSLHSDELINLDEPADVVPYKCGLEEVAESIMHVEMAQRSLPFQQMLQTAEDYFGLLQQAETTENGAKREELKQQLDELLEPFYHDATFVAALKLERLAKLGQ